MDHLSLTNLPDALHHGKQIRWMLNVINLRPN